MSNPLLCLMMTYCLKTAVMVQVRTLAYCHTAAFAPAMIWIATVVQVTSGNKSNVTKI